jgi:anti-sigma factor ChrR (cupin superfamily)
MNALGQVHRETNEELRELASAFVLDVMTEDERAAYEAHLRAGCAVCVAEVASFRNVAGAIASSVEPVSPRPGLRQELMSVIAKVQQADGKAPGVLYDKNGVLIARPREMEWNAGDLAGVFQKILFNDTVRGFTTATVRMMPGTRYPSHKHAGVEELYLLEGDLAVGKIKMQPGDYCRGEQGSIHDEIRTDKGCLFLVTSSHHDELLT